MRFLTGSALVLLCASCAGVPDTHSYKADVGPWSVELEWMHEFMSVPTGPDTQPSQRRFESLELILNPNRLGEDLPIDGEKVAATYEHGGIEECPRPHRVTGTVALLQFRATDVRARVDAVLTCPDSESVSLKGEFSFEMKVPP